MATYNKGKSSKLDKKEIMLRSLKKSVQLTRTLSLSSIIKSQFHLTPVSYLNQKLPKLPVPELQHTLEKYLRSVMPLLTADELQCTKCLVEEFGKKDGIGEKLQLLLMKKAEQSENWLEEWWLNAAYLGDRMQVVVHCSPGLVFPLQEFCTASARIDYAARLIIATLKYKQLIDQDKIPLEKMGKDPLDMGQYKKFFGTNRVPRIDLDELQYNPDSRHIIVACNNNFYRMCPMDEKNNILSLKQIKQQLQEIEEMSRDEGPAIGILSSDNRDTWANAYCLLTKDKENAKSVDIIQRSLFLVCLDKKPSGCSKMSKLTMAGHQTVHGGGIKSNSGNRWFDKTVQFVIGADGIVGLTYEHSPSEGQPIAVMTDFIVDNMKKIDECGPEVCSPCIQRLNFNVDCELERAIKTSANNLDNIIEDFDLECNIFEGFGKNFVKSQKLSPDSFIQMAMQYAYYRMYKKPVAHYESAATRKYLGGRTETIRSCSTESVKFAKGMLDCKMKDMDKRHLLEAAINSHKKYTLDAINGFGVDRHFLGLKLIAKQHKIPLPNFFKDCAFSRSNHFKLTSSQVATQCQGFMCYGAVVPDGYAICYNPRNDEIIYGVSCFNSDNTTCARKLLEAFECSLMNMKEVLMKTQKSKM